jgi:2-polyprenyl-6-methoxyphenol hydroxylase-like FAD-dependent oxidoreductase
VKRQVEIVGAGIAGLTTGLAFAQKGWRVRVHEQDSTLRLFGEGVHLWRNGLRVLDALGLLAPVISNAIPAFRHERRDSRGKAFSSCDFDPAFRLYLPLQPSLLAALYVALIETGGEVEFNSRAVSADPNGRLEFADGRRVRADLIVGADGINSVIRDSLGLLKQRRAPRQFGYRALIKRERGTWDTDTECTHWEYWSRSRRLLYAPATAEFAHVELTSVAGDASGNAVPTRPSATSRVRSIVCASAKADINMQPTPWPRIGDCAVAASPTIATLPLDQYSGRMGLERHAGVRQ